MVKTVAVVGSGASGLAVLRKLTAYTGMFDVVAFERSGEVGGIWNYSDKTGIDEEDGLPVHSCMYQNCRMNLPKDLVRYLDFPYREPLPCFEGHHVVREYLQDFTGKFDLQKYVKFRTIVTNVTPVSPERPDTTWEVTSREANHQGNTTTEIFDYVVLCNGHSAYPTMRQYPGMENFKGKVTNSHEYRVPETFKDNVVVCVGSGPSAMDIVVDLDGVAKKVYLCRDKSRALIDFTIPEGVTEKPDLDHVTENSMVFVNGDEVQIDVILQCAGYNYGYPFLSTGCKIVLEDKAKRVTPLYKHCINIEYPTMLFVGVPFHVGSLNLIDVHATFAAAVMAGDTVLPAKGEMEQDLKEDFEKYLQETGYPPRHYHKLGPRVFELMDSMLEMMGKPKLPEGYRKLFLEVLQYFQTESLTYRDIIFEMTDDTVKVITKK